MTEEEQKEERKSQWRVIVDVPHDMLEKALNDIAEEYRIRTLFTGNIDLADCPTVTVVGKRRKTDEEILREMKKKARRGHELGGYQKRLSQESR